jgi:hypothetical protein
MRKIPTKLVLHHAAPSTGRALFTAAAVRAKKRRNMQQLQASPKGPNAPKKPQNPKINRKNHPQFLFRLERTPIDCFQGLTPSFN